MSETENKSSHDPLYAFESAFDKDPLGKMDLPIDDQFLFEEEQPFDQAWIWALLGIETFAIMLPLVLTGQPWWVLLMTAGIMLMTLIMFATLRLRTRIDAYGVHFRMTPFHWKEKTIPWDEIDSIYVRTYSAISEYGGWGIRMGKNGKAFNVKGNQGIQIIRKDGKRILLGTQQSFEVSKTLSKYSMTV